MNRFTGRSLGGMLALFLLVCGCAFAAIAGPAESLHTRTQALNQTLDQLGAPAETIEADAPLGSFLIDTAGGGNRFSRTLPLLSASALGDAKAQLRQGLAATGVPLAAGAWAGLESVDTTIPRGYAHTAFAETQPKAAIVYRDDLARNVTLAAGRLTPVGSVPVGTIAVCVTPATAARFGLRPGSQLTLARGATLVVTGIVRPVGSGSIFWQADPTILTPALVQPPQQSPAYWLGGFLADPGQLAALQRALASFITIQWEFPLDLTQLNADQVGTLTRELNSATIALPPLSGQLSGAASDIALSTGLQQPLETFLNTQAAVLTVLLLLFVSLIAVGLAVIVLAARMIVDQRTDEIVMLRARGASGRQVAAVLASGSALAAVPAALIAVGLATAIAPGGGRNPGGSAVLGWSLAAATLAIAVAGPPLIGTWRHRRPSPAVNPALIMTAETRTARFSRARLRRVVAEVTACGGAIAGLAVLHGQGLPAAGSTNWYLTIAPVLLAIPAVVLIGWLYPLAIQLLLRLARRRAGATSYIALATSARASLATTGPVFALVLALTLAAFSGMLTAAVGNGQIAASWQASGADAVVNTGQVAAPVAPAAARAIAAVPGVQHEAVVWTTTWNTPGGFPVTVIAVDPAQYAAFTAATPYPALPAGKLAAPARPVTQATVISVLASPAAVTALGGRTGQLNSDSAMGPIQVNVAGTVSATPAGPSAGASGTFILMPLQTLPGTDGQPRPNIVLLTGSGIDRARLSATADRVLPGSSIFYRADTLATLQAAPLQHGALSLMLLTVITAAGFGLLNLILGLALGAVDRDLTFARLNVMGHAHSARLALTETLPAVLAAAVAGLACAVTLPALVGSAIDLSVFTGSGAAVTMRPDAQSLVLPTAIMFVIAVAALAAQTWLARRRGVTGLLRSH
jgi:putative ABC transport system permease protein